MAVESLFPRRQPCPCGSGRRFKDCCDGAVRIDPDRLRQLEAQAPGSLGRMVADLDRVIAAREGTPCP